MSIPIVNTIKIDGEILMHIIVKDIIHPKALPSYYITYKECIIQGVF